MPVCLCLSVSNRIQLVAIDSCSFTRPSQDDPDVRLSPGWLLRFSSCGSILLREREDLSIICDFSCSYAYDPRH
jgi:hypothetical protein